jgi:hypothetical protein
MGDLRLLERMAGETCAGAGKEEVQVKEQCWLRDKQ